MTTNNHDDSRPSNISRMQLQINIDYFVLQNESCPLIMVVLDHCILHSYNYSDFAIPHEHSLMTPIYHLYVNSMWILHVNYLSMLDFHCNLIFYLLFLMIKLIKKLFQYFLTNEFFKISPNPIPMTKLRCRHVQPCAVPIPISIPIPATTIKFKFWAI